MCIRCIYIDVIICIGFEQLPPSRSMVLPGSTSPRCRKEPAMFIMCLHEGRLDNSNSNSNSNNSNNNNNNNDNDKSNNDNNKDL